MIGEAIIGNIRRFPTIGRKTYSSFSLSRRIVVGAKLEVYKKLCMLPLGLSRLHFMAFTLKL